MVMQLADLMRETMNARGRVGRPNLNQLTGQPQLPAQTAAQVGGINFGTAGRAPTVTSQDDLIRSSTPIAENLIGQGTTDAIGLTQQGLQDQLAQLTGFQRPEAFNEQLALLGVSGADAQQQAIEAIPVSAAQREMEAMGMEGLRRQAAAGGNLSSGSGLLAQQQLGSQQAASRISNRLQELESLAGIDRQIAADISRLNEAAGSRIANLQQSRGSQLANVFLGSAPAAAQSIQSRAELEGLRGIGAANQQAQMMNQLANLAGQGAQAYQVYQNRTDPYGFGSSDPFDFSYGG